MSKYRRIIGFLILVFAVQLFGQSDALQIHGFISQGFMVSDENNFLGKTEDGTFEFNEFGINFSTELSNEFHVGLQLFARDLGYLGNDEVTVDWAYGDYRWKNWLGIRAGKIKMPLGLYNEYRDLDLARTSIFMPQGVYNETWRSTFNAIKGLGIYGSINTGVLGTFNYQGQVGALSVSTKDGLNKYIEEQLFAKFETYHLSTTYIGHLNWETPLPGLKLAGSTFMMDGLDAEGYTEDTEFWRNQSIGVATMLSDQLSLPMPTSYEEAQQIFALSGMDLNLVNRYVVQSIDNIKGYWISGEFTWNRIHLAGETFMLNTEITTVSPGYGAAIDPNRETLRATSDAELGGFYGQVGYQVTDAFAASIYYSEYYPDKKDKDGDWWEGLGLAASNAWIKDTAVSLRYDLNNHWTVKAEGHFMDGTAVMYWHDQDDPANAKQNWMLFAGKLTYNF
jgi:hypothetical protein